LMQATYKFTYVGGNSFFFSHLVETCCFGAYSSTLSTVAIIGGAITLLVGLFLLCAALQGFIVKPETNKVKYTAIPRVLVDLKYDEFGEKKYYNYYAAKSINPPEDMTESLALYGDLNALTTEYQWDALYYTKDPRVGTPLTAEIVVQNKNSLDLGQQEYYTPIHRFSSDVAADLNQYNGSATQTYVFVRKSGTSGTLGGSVFSEHPISTAIVSFIVGGGLAAGITYAMTRAKYKKEDSVA